MQRAPMPTLGCIPGTLEECTFPTAWGCFISFSLFAQ